MQLWREVYQTIRTPLDLKKVVPKFDVGLRRIKEHARKRTGAENVNTLDKEKKKKKQKDYWVKQEKGKS